jgi:hypothetical protein
VPARAYSQGCANAAQQGPWVSPGRALPPMADPNGMDVMCGAESTGGGDWREKLAGAADKWGQKGGSSELFDAAPPVGTVPQSSFRPGTAAHQAMQNAAEAMYRDTQDTAVEKGRFAAVNTDEFRNNAIGKGWKASYVVRQSELDDRSSVKVVDMTTRESVKRVSAEEKEARRLKRMNKRSWVEEYERSTGFKRPTMGAVSESEESDSSDSSGKKHKKKASKRKHKSKKHSKAPSKSAKKRKHAKESKEERRTRKNAEASRERILAYISLVEELSADELRQACEAEKIDAPPESAPDSMIRRVLVAKLRANLQAHDRANGIGQAAAPKKEGEEDAMQPLFS